MNTRQRYLFIITLFTFPFIIFNLIATLFVPFLGLFNYTFIIGLVKVELCIWALIIFSAVFIQRWHCSHSCAMTGIFELISIVTKSKDIMRMKYPKILKYIILLLWNAGFIYVAVCAMARHFEWFEVADIYASPVVVAYYTLFFISGILSVITGKSKTEHYVCPIAPWTLTAIKIGKKLGIPSYTITAD